MGVTYINPYRFAAFSPLDLSPALWLDASDTSTITQSSGAVSQWSNKGSLGAFTQSTAANQPTTGSSTLNSLNVISFDGGDYLNAAVTNEWKFLHDGTIYFISMVIKPGTGANPNALYGFVGNSIATAGIGAAFYYDDRSSASRNDAAVAFITRGTGGQFPVLAEDQNTLTPNTFSILSCLLDPSNATIANRNSTRVNGGSELKSNTGNNAVNTSNPTRALQIGALGNNLFPLVGSIAEIVIVSGANATDDNRQSVRDYLNAKWAVY